MFKPINGYTKQMMIDVIEKEFKGLSVNDSGQCAYRGVSGTKCAIGCFISDRLYKKGFEGSGIYFVADKKSFPSKDMPLNMDGLKAFQKVHDVMALNFSNKDSKQVLINWINENVRDV